MVDPGVGFFLAAAAADSDGAVALHALQCSHTRRSTRMIDLKAIDDLARRVSEMIPPGVREAGDELQQNVKATLQAGLAKLDLVTREEFEVQRAVLLRTREKLDALERTLQVLEARLATPDANQH